MKKTITFFTMLFACSMSAQVQSLATFENFSLSPNSFYTSTVSAPFQDGNAIFNHSWSGGYWQGGFSYTNKYDTITPDYNNLYGVRAHKGAGGSDVYAMAQSNSVIKFSSPQTTVNSIFVTNSTFAYKVILKGDNFSRKFGDTTGTGSGTTIAQGAYPDYFKLVIKGYLNGAVKNDSVEFFLADYRGSNDYVVDAWQQVNTSAIGRVDSLLFFLRSSDMSNGYINTPGFFGVDNVAYSYPSTVGLADAFTTPVVTLFPNPCATSLQLDLRALSGDVMITVKDMSGKTTEVLNANAGVFEMPTAHLAPGVYAVELRYENGMQVKRFIKN